MKILIKDINFRYTEILLLGKKEIDVIQQATDIDYEFINGEIRMSGRYKTFDNLADMTIKEIREKIEKYVKEEVLK